MNSWSHRGALSFLPRLKKIRIDHWNTLVHIFPKQLYCSAVLLSVNNSRVGAVKADKGELNSQALPSGSSATAASLRPRTQRTASGSFPRQHPPGRPHQGTAFPQPEAPRRCAAQEPLPPGRGPALGRGLPRPFPTWISPLPGKAAGSGPQRDPTPLTSAASSSPGSSRSRLHPRDDVTSSSFRQQLSTNSVSSSRSRRRSSTGGGSPSMAARPPRVSCGTASGARASGSCGRGHPDT